MLMRLITVMIICLAVAVCMPAAFAGTDGDIRCWTSNEDTYYHLQKDCDGNEKFPISEEAAAAFGKMPCGECIEKDSPVPVNEGEIRMAGRGGTYVLCIPTAMVDDAPEFSDGTEMESFACTGDEAGEQLKMLLGEADYQVVEKRLDADGWVRDTIRKPEISEDTKALTMNLRRIGNEWYMVIRPEKAFGKEADVRWHIDECTYQMESYGTLTVSHISGPEYVSAVSVADHTDAKSVYEKSFGDVRITVYREQGINTMVVHDSGKDDRLIGYLFIGGNDTGILLEGYVNSQKQKTFCCVITDEELGGFVAGRTPEIRYR